MKKRECKITCLGASDNLWFSYRFLRRFLYVTAARSLCEDSQKFAFVSTSNDACARRSILTLISVVNRSCTGTLWKGKQTVNEATRSQWRQRRWRRRSLSRSRYLVFRAAVFLSFLLADVKRRKRISRTCRVSRREMVSRMTNFFLRIFFLAYSTKRRVISYLFYGLPHIFIQFRLMWNPHGVINI